MAKLYLGDNQFFGINHMSEDKALAQAMKFKDTASIIRVLDDAIDEGIDTLMCTTHERIAGVTQHFRDNPERYSDFKFIPCMPYAHKYANAVTEHGMLGALKQYMPQSGLLDAALQGGKALANKDIEGVVKILIDTEMRAFNGVQTPIVMLQNVVVDLLLGMGFDDAFKIFDDHVRQTYDAEPGYITMNLPMLLKRLDSLGIRNPILCANFNKAGFRVSGGVQAYREALEQYPCRLIAMSVFASGAIEPREALQWVHDETAVEAIVFGASSRSNIHSTVNLVGDIWEAVASG